VFEFIAFSIGAEPRRLCRVLSAPGVQGLKELEYSTVRFGVNRYYLLERILGI